MNKLRLTVCALALMTAGSLYLAATHRADAADDLSAAQKSQVETVIHDYILKNPHVLVEALQSYQSQQGEQDAKAFKEKVGEYREFLTDASSPSAGNPKGDVTVVEFFDYNCGYCKHAVDDVQKLIGEDKNVRIVFKDYPILSESSGDAARFALAAGKQGKYWDFHQKLMKSGASKNQTTFEAIAKELNLDYPTMEKDANSKEIRAIIEKNTQVARSLSIQGTPAFIVGDTLIPGYIDADALKSLVDKAREGKN